MLEVRTPTKKEMLKAFRIGVKELQKIVGTTAGPMGNNVLIDNVHGEVQVSKDGVTVSDAYQHPNYLSNMAVKVIKEAANNTVNAVGDGTTTTILLATELYLVGRELIDDGQTPKDVCNEISNITDTLLSQLKDARVTDIEDKLSDIITVSSNGDAKIVDVVEEAIGLAGSGGLIKLQKSDVANVPTTITHKKCMVLNTGFIDSRDISDLSSNTHTMTDCAVFIFDGILDDYDVFSNILNIGLVIATDYSKEFLEKMTLDTRSLLKFIKTPEFGSRKIGMLEDLHTYTGSPICNDVDSIDDKITTVPKVIMGMSTIEIYGKSTTNDESFDNIFDMSLYVEKLVTLRDNTPVGFEYNKLSERIANLTNGTITIIVGGDSITSIGESYDRYEDAIGSAKAAISHGYVTGGGVAIRDAVRTIDRTKLSEAYLKPYKQILKNAGIKVSRKQMDDLSSDTSLNAKTGEKIDLVDDNILDPYIVTVTALTNATDVAIMLLSTGGSMSVKQKY